MNTNNNNNNNNNKHVQLLIHHQFKYPDILSKICMSKLE